MYQPNHEVEILDFYRRPFKGLSRQQFLVMENCTVAGSQNYVLTVSFSEDDTDQL